jgi:AhpC/TSA family
MSFDRRRFHARATALVAASALSFGLSAQAATVGQAAPDFSLKDTAGKTVKLSDFKGKTVVLEWVNPNCPFVKKHYADPGNMQSLQGEASGANVVWLAINSTAPDSSEYVDAKQLAAWAAERKAKPTAMLVDADGTVGKLYQARTTPHMYIVDAQGKLAYAGAIDNIPSARVADIPNAKNFVRTALTEIKAGKPVTEATTRPYGCSVKYKS